MTPLDVPSLRVGDLAPRAELSDKEARVEDVDALKSFAAGLVDVG